MDDQQRKQVQLQRMAAYYNPDAAPEDFKQLFKDAGDSYDDLDNSLYFLLNRFGSSVIRTRLKLAAEVHPHEIARGLILENAVSGEEDSNEAEPVVEVQRPPRLSNKLEQAKRLLGG